ncbi:MAG: hypothetical protein Q9227_001245 [Pyrenula ochraceoflavens]
MHPFPSLLALTTLATSTSAAVNFILNPFVSTDFRIPSESHTVNFTITNTNPFFEFGGGESAVCTLSWTDPSTLPTTYQPCTNNINFRSRITPGTTYDYAGDFSLDVSQVYVYEIVNENNATVRIEEGTGGLGCSRGGQTTVCAVQDGRGFNVSAGMYFGV